MYVPGANIIVSPSCATSKASFNVLKGYSDVYPLDMVPEYIVLTYQVRRKVIFCSTMLLAFI